MTAISEKMLQTAITAEHAKFIYAKNPTWRRSSY